LSDIPSQTDAPRLIGSQFAQCTLRELIGVGGTAEVYRASQRGYGNDCAVKVLRRERLDERDRVKAFQNEFDILHRLACPGIPVAQKSGEIDSRPCFQMDLMQGETLAALQADHAVLPGPSLLIAATRIVAFLHEHNLVHNDLKLENMILGPDGGLSLIDFGNAREARDSVIARLFHRKIEQIFGTITYVAPELLAGKRPSTQSDVYALGVCAFLLLTGKPPFQPGKAQDRPSERLRRLQEAKIPSIRDHLKNLPTQIATAIDACLARDPERRPDDAGVLLKIFSGWHRPPSGLLRAR